MKISKGKTGEAEQSIKWLRGSNYDSAGEISVLVAERAAEISHTASVYTSLTRKVTLKALSMGLGLMFFQQMSGINAVIFYTGDIFEVSYLYL